MLDGISIARITRFIASNMGEMSLTDEPWASLGIKCNGLMARGMAEGSFGVTASGAAYTKDMADLIGGAVLAIEVAPGGLVFDEFQRVRPAR